jgi:hypothetical protein
MGSAEAPRRVTTRISAEELIRKARLDASGRSEDAADDESEAA